MSLSTFYRVSSSIDSTRLSHNKLSTMSPPCDERQETLPDHSCGDLDWLSHVTTGDRAELISEISQKGIDNAL